MMQYLRKIKDLGITGSMAKWYDKNSRESRMEELKSYAKDIAALVEAGCANPAAKPQGRPRILEVAPGPGYISIELSKLGSYTITGMDISEDFIKICKANAERESADVDFVQGNVSNMPFADASFDFLFCSAAFKNFHDPAQALREMYRVLKPKGGGLIIDMNRNASNAALKAEVDKMRLRGFSHLWVSLTFSIFLRKGAYTRAEFETMLASSPFSNWKIKEGGIGVCIYLNEAAAGVWGRSPQERG
ncbi:MAG: class I SAM-dependent methyltransferase [Spirochaetaceae bacterium]|jgi:ubiquinone/menaquinone biosynthesis C-methylase UbiE|nr:class I SAM-dependent methyltransferase [Spirochaetaceae bacterium]